jgi:pimeloyl-ACP methyl ester carboxylesterase
VAAWQDSYWWSNDGLRLHYRDYAGGEDGRPVILCLPGLTRNARDFAAVADRLAPDWRLICVDLRGRGESAYAKDPMTYVPLTYLHDLEILLAELRLERVVLFGTSLGGMLSALLTSTGAGRVAGVLLNDIGPVLESGGLARIRTYVGRNTSCPTWLHAARNIAEGQRSIYPDYTIGDWLAMTKRLCRLTPGGRIVYDYDMKIAEPLRVPGGESGFDMWPAFESLKGLPVTLLRGELSDLLGTACAAEMAGRIAGLDLVTVPRVGHAPNLEEAESVAAIDRLLARVLTER